MELKVVAEVFLKIEVFQNKRHSNSRIQSLLEYKVFPVL